MHEDEHNSAVNARVNVFALLSRSCYRFVCVQFVLVFKNILAADLSAFHSHYFLLLFLCDLESSRPSFGQRVSCRNIAGVKTDIGFEVLLCAALPGKALGDSTKLISACCGQIAMQ